MFYGWVVDVRDCTAQPVLSVYRPHYCRTEMYGFDFSPSLLVFLKHYILAEEEEEESEEEEEEEVEAKPKRTRKTKKWKVRDITCYSAWCKLSWSCSGANQENQS